MERNQPIIEGVVPVKCVWSGGGGSIWKIRIGERELFRVVFDRVWLGDFKSESDASDAFVRAAVAN